MRYCLCNILPPAPVDRVVDVEVDIVDDLGVVLVAAVVVVAGSLFQDCSFALFVSFM